MISQLLHRLVAQPAVYNFVQKLCGAEITLRKLRAILQTMDAGIVMDIGAGTGNGLRALPPGARYLWLDNDAEKLNGFLRRERHASMAVLGSATALPLRSRSVDTALCIAMSHHLDWQEVCKLFAEIARVCRGQMVFLDLAARPESLVSSLLWKYDRGSFPRQAAQLRSLVGEHFQIEHEELYTIYHQYWLCVARPLNNGAQRRANDHRGSADTVK
jgi:ubiquinone/menaquinone biosynthesis C-methylase UbiE